MEEPRDIKMSQIRAPKAKDVIVHSTRNSRKRLMVKLPTDIE